MYIYIYVHASLNILSISTRTIETVWNSDISQLPGLVAVGILAAQKEQKQDDPRVRDLGGTPLTASLKECKLKIN